ncbi:MAG: NAD(P)-dependent alcohol dehydrogenase [Proteobacteria bacterium]|nr:MAG: NAD(P)-dependent alcohol dehydrogenase [Pseudomonadota bacterium]
MKAAKFTVPGFEHLEMSSTGAPLPPGRDEIMVKIFASSLNGHDLNVIKGRLPVSQGRILLTDGAGIVQSVGDGVTEFAAGDTVISTFFPSWTDGAAPIANFSSTPGDGVDGFGTEVSTRHVSAFTKAPRGWSPTEAATLPTAGLTAYRALVIEGKIKAGDHVLLLGTGGVSVLALQIAKALGATVTITSSSDEKLERARVLGADHTVNYKTFPDWATKINETTKQRGVDLVLETGGPGTLPQSIAAARIGGTIILVGVVTGTAGVVPTAAIMGKQLKIFGITVGSRTDQQKMVSHFSDLSFRPHIDKVFKLENLSEAFTYQESNQHFGKICIEV